MMLWLLLLILAMAAYVFVGRRTARERLALGIPSATIVAADDARLGASTLRSRRLGLVGRPDHLVRQGRMLIPVEQKARAGCTRRTSFRSPHSACSFKRFMGFVRYMAWWS
jgi:hypothetical protein